MAGITRISIPYESKRLFYELRYMDMCRKYINGLRRNREEEESQELTPDVVREKRPGELYGGRAAGALQQDNQGKTTMK